MILCILSFFKDIAEVDLDKVLDDDEMSELHLGKIADAMFDWKGKIAEHLHLSLPETEEIKMANRERLDLQKYKNSMCNKCPRLIFRDLAGHKNSL